MTLSYLFHANSTDLSQLVRLKFGLSMYLDRNLGLRLSLSEITLLFDLCLYLDRIVAQRKAKSKVKVTRCVVPAVSPDVQRLAAAAEVVYEAGASASPADVPVPRSLAAPVPQRLAESASAAAWTPC